MNSVALLYRTLVIALGCLKAFGHTCVVRDLLPNSASRSIFFITNTPVAIASMSTWRSCHYRSAANSYPLGGKIRCQYAKVILE